MTISVWSLRSGLAPLQTALPSTPPLSKEEILFTLDIPSGVSAQFHLLRLSHLSRAFLPMCFVMYEICIGAGSVCLNGSGTGLRAGDAAFLLCPKDNFHYLEG